MADLATPDNLANFDAVSETGPQQGQQFLRRCSLSVQSQSQVLDLSNLRIQFRTVQSDIETPNHTIIRVFNLSDNTAKSVQNEFQTVTLAAGYENGPFGVIFTGTIKQVRRGRVDPTLTYLDVMGADGDQAYNYAFVNQTIAAGYQQADVQAKLRAAMDLQQGNQALPSSPAAGTTQVTPGAAQRGKVMFGLARDHMRVSAKTNNQTWSIQQGKLQTVSRTSYIQGSIVELNAQSGMIDLPEQTEGGILIKCLLNPNLQIGQAVRINNKSIQRAFLGANFLFAEGRLDQNPDFQQLLPKITDDGLYRIYVCEFKGDTRGPDWYAHLTCLTIDQSANTNQAVQAGATQ